MPHKEHGITRGRLTLTDITAKHDTTSHGKKRGAKLERKVNEQVMGDEKRTNIHTKHTAHTNIERRNTDYDTTAASNGTPPCLLLSEQALEV
jgi:hypothetical protein